MSREQKRIWRKLEDNPVAEYNKIRNRYCHELLRAMLYKELGGIESMQSQ
ncbi:MAG: hypothetical protein K2N82_09270 [Lachnospiraceae bacterium]|nr:hypothetical protein [Lachnospiraceae bacterium]